MTHSIWCIGWIRVSLEKGYRSSSDSQSFFPALCTAPAWCPPQRCSCPNPRPPAPSLPYCRCPKEEGERAARPTAQVVFSLAHVFLHTPWSSSSPGADSFGHFLVAAAASLASCFMWCGAGRGGGQQEGENRRGKKEFMEPLQDLFDPLQIQVSSISILPN
jgi:hypothetical protein